MAVTDLHAEQVHQSEFAGNPGTAGNGMDAGTFLRSTNRWPLPSDRAAEVLRGTEWIARPARWQSSRTSRPRSAVPVERAPTEFQCDQQPRPGQPGYVGCSSIFRLQANQSPWVCSSVLCFRRQPGRAAVYGVLKVHTGRGGCFSQSTRSRLRGGTEAEHAQVHLQIGNPAIERGGRDARSLASAGQVLMTFE